jgi:Mg-chelatase subunit ChlD
MTVPPEFVCPITLDVMNDPVVMPDGHTYERVAITEALARKPISPLTRQPMIISSARPNYAIKSLIDTWRSGHEAAPTVPTTSDPPGTPGTPIASHPSVIQSPAHIELAEFTAHSDAGHLHVRVTPKPTEGRLPLALIAMIDISGSMGQNVCRSVRGLESVDISRLALVQHALKTIIEVLGDEDQVTFITFSDDADLLLPATPLTAAGKSAARMAINSMQSTNSTNIWAALRSGLRSADQFRGLQFNTSLLLFTDGEPNINPPRGILTELRDALAQMTPDFTISTFGFGYKIDSDLMENIARLGHGVYGYCPDCTMVGTIFINFLANSLTTVAQRAKLEIRGLSSKLIYPLTLLNGSSRNVIIDIDDATNIEVVLTIPSTGDRFVLNHAEPVNEGDEGDAKRELVEQIYRRKYISIISDNLFTPDSGLQQAQTLFDEISALPTITPFLQSLLIDLVNPHPNHGQISKAFEGTNFAKWGKDFLRSHVLFHIFEQCGNFKDESLQNYAGSKFCEYRTMVNKVFIDLPPPQPRSCQTSDSVSHMPVQMDAFYDYNGGCFDGDAIVELIDGNKRVRDLVKGDRLHNGGIVECVLETITNKRCPAVVLNGVAFTPFHPVLSGGAWVFPNDLGPVVEVELDAWFNLVVSGPKSVLLNGIPAITLGHGMTEGVLEHPYFGTEVVINALKAYDGYASGRVTMVTPKKCRRDANGMITDLF